MATARRETVLAALETALDAISTVVGLVVERNRRGWIDGDADLAAGPRLVVYDADQEVTRELPTLKIYRATPLVEGYVRGTDASVASTALEALYAAAITAIEDDAALAAAAFIIRPGDMEPGLDAEAGHRSVVGFGFKVRLDYITAAADPYALPA